MGDQVNLSTFLLEISAGVKTAGVNGARPVAVPGSIAAMLAASAQDSARNIDEQRAAASKMASAVFERFVQRGSR